MFLRPTCFLVFAINLVLVNEVQTWNVQETVLVLLGKISQYMFLKQKFLIFIRNYITK